jgi:hypothetical protein
VLPKISITPVFRVLAMPVAASLGSGPPEENIAARRFLITARSTILGMRFKCAGLEMRATAGSFAICSSSGSGYWYIALSKHLPLHSGHSILNNRP